MIARLDRYLGGHSHLRGLMAAHGLAGLLQGAALGLLVPFLRAFLSGERGAAGAWLAWIVVAACASALISAAATVRSYRIGADDVCGGLIRAVGQRIQQLPLGWFDSAATGRVSAATSTGIHALSHLPSLVLPQIASMTGSAAAIAVLNPCSIPAGQSMMMTS